MRQFPRQQWSLQARGPSAISDFARICITAASGGGGKTLVALGLCRIFAAAGLAVKPFKKGPDYIDAAWLAAAAGRPATNLDPFFMDQAALSQLFAEAMSGCDLAVIEGNRGLYDGLNESGSCSTSQVARGLKAPLVLCVDCRKVTRTACALILGLTSFEPGLNFAGVILNRVGSRRHAASLQAAIRENTDLPVLGCLPRWQPNPLPERHMGLASAGQDLISGLEQKLDQIAGFIRDNCDTDAILAAARAAPRLDIRPAVKPCRQPVKARIGVVRDQALWFYYPENLAALEQAGAEIRELSLLDAGSRNRAAWREVDGIYLGGGFPEDYCAEISGSPFLASLRKYADSGMPIYAECGGMIVLASRFWRQDRAWPMAGVLDHDIIWTDRPQGLGYVEARVCGANPWYEQRALLRGHEFHYARSAQCGLALELLRGAGTGRNAAGHAGDGFCKGRVWASFMHIFAPAVPQWAPAFVRLAAQYNSESAADPDHLAACDGSAAALSQNV